MKPTRSRAKNFNPTNRNQNGVKFVLVPIGWLKILRSRARWFHDTLYFFFSTSISVILEDIEPLSECFFATLKNIISQKIQEAPQIFLFEVIVHIFSYSVILLTCLGNVGALRY